MVECVTRDRLHACLLARRHPHDYLFVNLFSLSVCIYACVRMCLSVVHEEKKKKNVKQHGNQLMHETYAKVF